MSEPQTSPRHSGFLVYSRRSPLAPVAVTWHTSTSAPSFWSSSSQICCFWDSRSLGPFTSTSYNITLSIKTLFKLPNSSRSMQKKVFSLELGQCLVQWSHFVCVVWSIPNHKIRQTSTAVSVIFCHTLNYATQENSSKACHQRLQTEHKLDILNTKSILFFLCDENRTGITNLPTSTRDVLTVCSCRQKDICV